MTYHHYETSPHGGEPVELYRFINGAKTWRYTSCDATVAHGGFTWNPEYIKRSAPEISREQAASGLTLTVRWQIEPAMLYLHGIPVNKTWVTILRTHVSDPDRETIKLFQGAIGAVRWRNSEAEIKIDATTKVIKRESLKHGYQSTCAHMHYDNHCGLIRGDYTATGKVAAVNGTTLTIAEASVLPDGHYNAGILVINGEARMITAHSGNQIKVLTSYSNVSPGADFEILPGCDRSFGTCRDRYANTDNYGGFPYIPTKNPFEQGLI